MRRAAFLLLLAVAACGGGRRTGASTSPGSPARDPATATDAGAPRETIATPIAIPREGAELIGRAAPDWELDGWLDASLGASLDGKGTTLAALRGRPVLVRFFTNTCPFCAASMPALEKIHGEYGEKYRGEHADDGLVVLGFYHPKPFGADRPREDVRRMLDRWCVTFPVGLDTQWRTLRRYWLDSAPGGERRSATSASFLIDRKGVFRFVHPGPELHPEGDACNAAATRCARDFTDLENAVRVLLAER